MSAAIKVESGSKVHLKNVNIRGADIGISSDGSPGSEVRAENVRFEDVRLPYDIPGGNPAYISGSRVTNDPKRNSNRTGSSVGWRRLEGPPLPVFCPICKAIFASQNHQFAGTYFLWDNEEPCIECGYEHARLSEGVFDLTKEAARVLIAPDITYVLLAALSGVLKKAADGEIDIAEAARTIDAISPSIGDIFKRAAKFGASAAMLLFTIVGAIYGVKTYNTGERTYELTERSVQFVQDQLRLAKESGQSSDRLLGEILDHLKHMDWTRSNIGKTSPSSQPMSSKWKR